MIRDNSHRGTSKFSWNLFSWTFFLFLIVFGPSESWSKEGTYPDRPINMVVPFGAGGAMDLGSKIMGDKISQFLGQPLISVYKPGGGGSLGSAFVARAKADGYTILAGSPTFLSIPTIAKKLDYSFHDFIPAGMYGKIPHWLVVKSDARWKNLKDFVEEEKKTPGTLKVGYLGKLSSTDFTIVLLNKHAGINLTQVPYASSGVALTSLLGGHIEAALVTGAGGLLESGQIRILAVADEKRLEGLADVPTFKECGYPFTLWSWNSFFFPKETPNEIVKRFSKAQQSAISKFTMEIKEGLRRVEIWPDFRSPEDTMEQYKKDYALYFKLCQQLGVVAK